MSFSCVEGVLQIHTVRVLRQATHVDEVRPHIVNHGIEGVAVPPTATKVLDLNAEPPGAENEADMKCGTLDKLQYSTAQHSILVYIYIYHTFIYVIDKHYTIGNI